MFFNFYLYLYIYIYLLLYIFIIIYIFYIYMLKNSTSNNILNRPITSTNNTNYQQQYATILQQ